MKKRNEPLKNRQPHHHVLLQKIRCLFKPPIFDQSSSAGDSVESAINRSGFDQSIIRIAQDYLGDEGSLMPYAVESGSTFIEQQDDKCTNSVNDESVTDKNEQDVNKQNASQLFLDQVEMLLSEAVKVHRPEFIGHMTSALPFYVPSLMYLLGSLNQNLVKFETSGGFSVLEKSVLISLHRQIYNDNSAYYDQMRIDGGRALGVFCSGGTVGNLTALWALRRHFSTQKLNRSSYHPCYQQGMNMGLLRIYVSELGHYSISKSIDVLGFLPEQMVVLPPACFSTAVHQLELRLAQDVEQGCIPFIIIGIAGSTETGSVDHLESLARVAQRYQCYFHVDAAWGGAFIVAGARSRLFKGIEKADSIVIDAHKQLYVPIGCGLVLFKSEYFADAIQFKSNYIIRKGSSDLGQWTLEGSRPALSFILYAHLRLIGFAGFRLLFEYLFGVIDAFASFIQQSADFQLMTQPTLNIITYRFRPPALTLGMVLSLQQQRLLDQITIALHEKQKDSGQFFVSRTRLLVSSEEGYADVFRVVIANPNSTIEHCQNVLQEQRLLVQNDFKLQALVQQSINKNETK